MKGFLISFAAVGVGLYAATFLFDGIRISGPFPALAAVLLLWFVGVRLKPLLRLLTFPINFMTLGLFALAVNAAILWTAAWAVEGFYVDGMVSALAGGVIVSLASAFSTKAVG